MFNHLGILLGFSFCYLSLKICVRSDVQSPVRSFVWMIYSWAQPHVSEWWETVRCWSKMDKKPLVERMGMCRQLNLAMCLAQALVAFISIFRWVAYQQCEWCSILGVCFHLCSHASWVGGLDCALRARLQAQLRGNRSFDPHLLGLGMDRISSWGFSLRGWLVGTLQILWNGGGYSSLHGPTD